MKQAKISTPAARQMHAFSHAVWHFEAMAPQCDSVSSGTTDRSVSQFIRYKAASDRLHSLEKQWGKRKANVSEIAMEMKKAGGDLSDAKRRLGEELAKLPDGEFEKIKGNLGRTSWRQASKIGAVVAAAAATGRGHT